MQFGRNVSDNVSYKYFGMIYFLNTSMQLNPFRKIKSNIENDDEIYAMAFECARLPTNVSRESFHPIVKVNTSRIFHWCDSLHVL